MIEPYVDEEVAGQCACTRRCASFPTLVGYEYPGMYIKLFGGDYEPEPYIVAEYERARNHKWYMTSRLITMNDIYSFDPTPRSISTTSPTLSDATSSSRRKGWASTIRRRRTCGAH